MTALHTCALDCTLTWLHCAFFDRLLTWMSSVSKNPLFDYKNYSRSLVLTTYFICLIFQISNVNSSIDRTLNIQRIAPTLEGVEVVSAKKVVSIDKSLVTTKFHLTYSNNGAKTHSNVYFILNETDYKNLAVFSYEEGAAPKETIKKSKFQRLAYQNPDTKVADIYQVYEVSLLSPLQSGDSIVLVFTIVFTNSLITHPMELELTVPPMYVFEDTVNVLSLYPVSTQTSTYKFKACRLISYTPQTSVEVVDQNELKYSINDKKAPLSNIPFWIHLSTSARYTSTRLLHRKVFVSEYADVEFVESHTIHNQANKLVGEFSRERVADSHLKGSHVINSILFRLPKDSYSYYYRDMVGNISTSALIDTRNYRQMEVTPRFPLMGGWNTEFTIKYKRPANKVIKKQSHQIDALRQLNINLLGVCDDIVSVDDFILEVILPERAQIINFDIPSIVDFTVSKYSTYYYMDMYGRYTLRVEAHNLIPEQDARVQIVYSYNSIYLLMKPYYASFVFFIVLFSISILSRTKIFDSHDDAHKSKVDDLLEHLQEFDDLCVSQLELLKELVSFLDSYRSKPTKRKNFEGKFSSLVATVNNNMKALDDMHLRLFNMFPDCKVDQEKKIGVLKEDLNLINEYHELVGKLRDGNLSENEFLKAYKTIENQINCNKEIISPLFDQK